MVRLYTRCMIKPALPLLTLLLTLAGTANCSASSSQPGAEELKAMLGNAIYEGIEDHPVQLADGVWEGEPFVEGGASRPRVGLVRDFMVLGDVDGDGVDEALVAIWQSSGGSGTFNYIALAAFEAGKAVNLATAEVGDRVKIEAASIENGMIRLEVIEHGPDEPACCPTRKATRRYDKELNPITDP